MRFFALSGQVGWRMRQLLQVLGKGGIYVSCGEGDAKIVATSSHTMQEAVDRSVLVA